ncbi:hypothetical protein SHL15_7430 [Streptomyces hygroscopicus subsp. limoneus]|nr:hypothetical protein SHL15_7430 [Streptomyces hygroscopicus subsp. limoneus]
MRGEALGEALNASGVTSLAAVSHDREAGGRDLGVPPAGGRIGRVTGSSVNGRSVRTAPTTAGSASPLDDGDRGDPARAVGVGAGAGAGAGGGVAGIEPQALVLVLER